MEAIISGLADSLLACGLLSLLLMVISLLIRFCRRQRHFEVPAHDVRKGHRWRLFDLFWRPTYCNISGALLSEGGAQCEYCSIYVDEDLLRTADQELPCKPLSSKQDPFTHQWVCGNLPKDAHCCVCDAQCEAQDKLSDFRCCWCLRSVHSKCHSQVENEECDLGELSSFIIPPTHVDLRLTGMKGRRHWVVSRAEPVESKKAWSPLVVVANRKSGSNEGSRVLHAFRRLLNPTQVIDLADVPPEAGLGWCSLLPGVRFRLLVAGGDGTVGWVLSAIDKLNLNPTPEIAILPLGTGNDLSRVLGWGEGHEGELDAVDLLSQISRAKPVQLDRWQISIDCRRRFGIKKPKRTLVMNNYMSLGVDALVALNFHRHREKRPGFFGNRMINKFWYFTYGTKDVLERECKYLHKNLSLEVDGRRVNLPRLEGIVVLNIGSWGAGCRPWPKDCSMGDGCPAPLQRNDDQLLEVIGLYSSFHIAQIQVGLADPVRIAQGAKIKLTLKDTKAPMQVDGEPWEQVPGQITVLHHNQATMLKAKS